MKDVMVSIDIVESALVGTNTFWNSDAQVVINDILKHAGFPAKYVFCSECKKHLLASAKREYCTECKPLDSTDNTHGLYVALDNMENCWCVLWKDSLSHKVIKSGFQSRDLASKYLAELVTR